MPDHFSNRPCSALPQLLQQRLRPFQVDERLIVTAAEKAGIEQLGLKPLAPGAKMPKGGRMTAW
jgi:hypothetical protein